VECEYLSNPSDIIDEEELEESELEDQDEEMGNNRNKEQEEIQH